MSKVYTSKYPKIITDNRGNSVNESLKKQLTIEEYYDIMHHTHDASSILNKEDIANYEEMQNSIKSLTETVNTLQVTIKNMQDQINNMPPIGDWDTDTPGIQDQEGNDLGTLMGFTMTEIE